MQKPIFFIFITILALPAQAIVNIESIRAKKEKGTYHQTEVTGAGAGGNSDNFRLGASHATAWKQELSQSFFVTDYKYGESNKIKDTNQLFFHLRHSRDIGWEDTLLELFSQWQYNEFQRLNSRFLLGSGLRYQLFNSEHIQWYFGFGGFWYQEDIADKDNLASLQEEGGRWNSYVSFTWTIDPQLKFVNTAYFQPHMKYLKDHTVLWDVQMQYSLTKLLKVTINWSLAHDNNPPKGIQSTDTKYMAGLLVNY